MARHTHKAIRQVGPDRPYTHCVAAVHRGVGGAVTIDEILAALRDVRRALVSRAEQARLDGKAEMADGYWVARDRVSEAIENIEWAAKQ